MQTLSRYFVAFLLLLVSSFLKEKEPETDTQQASLEKEEINLELKGSSHKDKGFFYRCS